MTPPIINCRLKQQRSFQCSILVILLQTRVTLYAVGGGGNSAAKTPEDTFDSFFTYQAFNKTHDTSHQKLLQIKLGY